MSVHPGHAQRVANIKHQLWNYERLSAGSFEERRERAHRVDQLRSELVTLGATPVGEQSK